MSPEPVSNGITSVAELGLVTSIALAIWQHPYVTLFLSLVVLVALVLTVRLIWKALRQVFSGQWVPRRGFSQDARTSDRLGRRDDDE